MIDTHINAFYADVDEKKQAVITAQGELEAAEVRLETKKQELGLTDSVEKKEEKVSDDNQKKSGLFNKKKVTQS